MLRNLTIGLAVSGLILLVVLGIMRLGDRPQRAAIPPPPQLERPVVVGEPGAPGESADDDPDSLLRQAVARVSAHPQLVRWIARDGLVRRLVAAVEDVASGASPVQHLGFLQPQRRFSVVERTDRTTANPAAYSRYDLPAEVLVSIDTGAAVVAYQAVRDQLEQAHREVTPLNVGFHERLLEAIDHLLDTPIPDDEPALVPMITAWAYVDPELEALSDAQRHLLRMGPRNAHRVQAKLAELRAALGEDRPGRDSALAVREDGAGPEPEAAVQPVSTARAELGGYVVCRP